MDAFLRYLALATVILWSCVQVQAAPPDTNHPTDFRLTVELKDGSRVIGKSRDESFEFRSDILGKSKLPLEKIRAIEAEGKTNLVKLTTVGADTLTVEFVMKDIRVETAFGDVKLPVSLIKSIRVSVIGKLRDPRDGLIGLWSGEGDAVDSVGGNNGLLQNVGFVKGVVGRAFSFGMNGLNGGNSGVQIPDKPAYALTNSLSIECWIRPHRNGNVIFFRGDHRPGLDPYCLSFSENNMLAFYIYDAAGTMACVQTPIDNGVWIHVAAVLDDDTGTMNLYTNGVRAAQTVTSVRPFGPLLEDESPGIGIGNVNDGGNTFPFYGEIDEIALYNRALSEDEVNASYAENAANAGERAPMRPNRISPYNPRLRSRNELGDP
jgi:hypothetical protein